MAWTMAEPRVLCFGWSGTSVGFGSFGICWLVMMYVHVLFAFWRGLIHHAWMAESWARVRHHEIFEMRSLAVFGHRLHQIIAGVP